MTHHGNKESEFDNKESRTTILGMLATVYALNGNNFSWTHLYVFYTFILFDL